MRLYRRGPLRRFHLVGAQSRVPPPDNPPAGTLHYVSADGNGSWAQSTSYANPCAPATALAEALAGDTCLFRGGTYQVAAETGNSPSYPTWNPAHSGTLANPITFAAYPGEIPVVNVTTDDAPEANSLGNWEADCFGVVEQDYIIWDGFAGTCNGGANTARVYMWASRGSVFRNLRLNGGSMVVGSWDNNESIRIEQCYDFLISRCAMTVPHQDALNGTTHTIDNHNTSAIKLYHNQPVWTAGSGGTIEYCEIDGQGVGACGVYVKSTTSDLVIRNNDIHGLKEGCIVTVQGTGALPTDRGTFSNNLVRQCSYQGFGEADENGASVSDWRLSNNTFYAVSQTFGYSYTAAGHGWKFYNNLSQNNSGYYEFSCGRSTPQAVAECDHNQWGTGTVRWQTAAASAHRYASLAAWQASTELEGGGHPGVGDLASDPLFVNGSGALTEIGDFALQEGSPCKGAGRNGADMGCDVTAVGVAGA